MNISIFRTKISQTKYNEYRRFLSRTWITYSDGARSDENSQ